MSQRKIGSRIVLAGILLFVADSVACIYIAEQYAAEDLRRYQAGIPSQPVAFGWSHWPDPCALWFWLVVIGFGIRFLGRNVPAEERPPITHEVALIYHLFPAETGFVREQGGFFSDLVPQVADGLQQLPLPQLEFTAPRTYLKVRPPKDAKPKLATPFFEALHRAVTSPFSFELVAESGTVYFQIACVPADQPAIEQQLALYFPGSETQPHTPDLSQMISMTHCRYERALGSKKTLSDFALDPYAPLFALLDNLPATDGLVVSVHCIPIREETMAFALSYAERQAAGEPGFSKQVAQAMKNAAAAKVPVAGQVYQGYTKGVAERTQRIQKMLPGVIHELATKLPAWGMVVEFSFFFDQKEPFGETPAHFFAQYETAEYKWLGTNDADFWQQQLRFETKYVDIALPYCIVACDELAALAHFPNAATQCQRLERAGAASGLPPALYLE